MKGKYTVKVSNNRVAYTLELERNITILTGESGIGKTALARLIQNFDDAGRQSGVTVQCKVPCRSITSDDGWESRLNAIHNSIIFIDEGRKFLQTKSFAETVAGNDNYFVLITRESLSQIPYSVRSILTLKNTKRIGSKHYSRTYERFDFISHFSDAVSNSEYLLTEDSNAGFEAYEKLTEGTSCVCISAKGKSNIPRVMMKYGNQRLLIVADGAAFGSEMSKVYKYYQERPDDVTLFLPESFEWLVLRSGIVSDRNLNSILKKPWNYILSEKYMSWELYFTDLLKKITAETRLQYSKTKLTKGYLTQSNIRKLKETIEREDTLHETEK